MTGSGCKSCPVVSCDTLRYRGSRCAALRDKHGLGDPATNADRFRTQVQTDEGLAQLFADYVPSQAMPKEVREIWQSGPQVTKVEAWLRWLQQPAFKQSTNRGPGE